MDVSCILTTYDPSDKVAPLLVKVMSSPYDGKKVTLSIKQQGETLPTTVNVVGDELISAVQRCLLNWRGV